MGGPIIWLAIRIVFTLLPAIFEALKEEKQKQSGRDEVVEAVKKRFEDAGTRAEKARTDTANDLASGSLPDTKHRRD